MQGRKLKRTAVIPAYKPDKMLPDLVKKLRKCGFYTVVVDDGSGAEYREIFEEVKMHAALITCRKNHGKGSALKTGIKYIERKFGAGAVTVTLDADGQHSAEDALRAVRTAAVNPGTLVLGSRRMNSTVPLRSRFGNKLTRAVFHAKSGVRVYDTQTGLRAFTSDLAGYLAGVSGERYEYEINVLMQCAADCVEIIEIPVTTIYIGENESSHFNPVRDSFRIYRAIFSFRNKRGSEE